MECNRDVREVITEALVGAGNPDQHAVVTAATPLADGGLELTSLALVRALLYLEERLDVDLEEAAVQMADFRTVGDITEAVLRAIPATLS